MTLRNFSRNKLLSSTIIFGLTLGILSSFLILSNVLYELSYDKYLPDYNRVYRITSDYSGSWGTQQIARCYYEWINNIKDEYPEVTHLVKFFNPNIPCIRVNDNKFTPINFIESDSTFFQVFPFEFIYGNASSALQAPHSIVITNSIAHKYFGTTNPIGKSLEIFVGDSNSYKYNITGVIKDAPVNSHFHPNYIATWINGTVRQMRGYYYVVLRHQMDAKILSAELPKFVARHLSHEEASEFSLHIQALTDIHLKSHLEKELEPNSNINQIYALSIVAI